MGGLLFYMAYEYTVKSSVLRFNTPYAIRNTLYTIRNMRRRHGRVVLSHCTIHVLYITIRGLISGSFVGHHIHLLRDILFPTNSNYRDTYSIVDFLRVTHLSQVPDGERRDDGIAFMRFAPAAPPLPLFASR